MRERLWRREAARFTVEIFVGATWVPHKEMDGNQTFEDAKKEARKILLDAAVRKVRVVEHSHSHVADVVFADDASPVLRAPSKMTLQKAKKPCPVCGTLSATAEDGTFTWVMCQKCNKTLPT